MAFPGDVHAVDEQHSYDIAISEDLGQKWFYPSLSLHEGPNGRVTLEPRAVFVERLSANLK